MHREVQAVVAALAMAMLCAACAGAPTATSHPPSPDQGSALAGLDADPETVAQVERALAGTEAAGVDVRSGWARNGLEDPVVGPHDLLDILVFDAPELSRSARVSAGGEIALPLLGVIPVSGLTSAEVAEELERRLADSYMTSPHVTVQVTESPNRHVYVFGEVNRPGALQMNARDRLTVLQAVAMGGGTAPLAARSRAVVIRPEAGGGRLHIPVNLDQLVKGRTEDLPLLPNDVLFVPRSTARSFLGSFWGAFTRLVTLRAIF
jgi:polysaccharide biosynthesis/export protein